MARSALAPLALAVAIVLAGTALYTQAEPPAAPAAGAPAADSWWDATVESFDGTRLAVTVFRPAGATADAPVPVVLHSHGWSGSRATSPSGLVGALLNASYGVVAVDARGHGESGGFAAVHHEDFEVKDFQAVLDWVHDELAWVQREPHTGVPRDVVAGAAGYSYAGGIQLQLAARDARLDVIAPEITWTFLPDALAPEGVPKSVWLDFLYGTAKESGTRIDPRIDGWYREAMLGNAFPPAAYEHFLGSSPDVAAIGADVLFVQGVPDGLFPLNQAVAGYLALEGRPQQDVRLFTHLSGHVLPGVQPVGLMETRRAPFQVDTPCGNLHELVVAWMDERLRGLGPSGIPEVSFALDDGECLALPAYPHATVEAKAAVVPAPSAAGTVLVPLLDGPAVVAGVPHLRASVGDLGAPGVAHVGLVLLAADGRARVVDDQAQPVRLSPGATLDLDLAGVAVRLDEGDRLLLRVDGLNEWYLHNGQRLPGGAVLQDVVVTLPVVPGA